METNKLDRQIREELNKREITPSAAAWDRLDAMLTVAEKPKRSFRWMYIAASIAGFLLIGTVFFNQKENTISVNNNEVVIKEGNGSIKTNDNAIEDFVPSQIISDKQIVSIVSKENIIVAEKKKSSLNNKKSKELIQKSSSIINQKTEQKSIVSQSNSANDEALLASVEKVSKAENAIPQYKIKVNANSLLSQVDGELELSFREKVIGKVNKNYQTVKVALANRNLE